MRSQSAVWLFVWGLTRLSCKSKANATKSFKILHAPPILTLHLKRFAVNYGYNGKPRANKNTQFIEYPESLDIAPYMVDPKVSSRRRGSVVARYIG